MILYYLKSLCEAGSSTEMKHKFILCTQAAYSLGSFLQIIVVDDGSTDETANTGYQYTKKYGGKVRVLKLEKNLGKGRLFKSSQTVFRKFSLRFL